MKNVTDAHVQQLVASYRRHYAEYCKQKGYVTQQSPFAVWQKVHVDFLTKFPGTKFDVALLKTQLRQGLQKYRNTPLPADSVDTKRTLAAMTQGVTSMNAKPVPPVAVMQVSSQLAVRSAATTVAVPQVPASLDVKPTQIAMVQTPVALNSATSQLVNGTTQRASDNNVATLTPVVKIEYLDPIAAAASTKMTDAAVVQQSVLNNESLDAISSRGPASIDKSCPANGTASNDQEASADSRQSQPQQPSEISLKRRKRSNHAELQDLKKRKLALENLKLEVELGLITLEEAIEGGKRVLLHKPIAIVHNRV